MTTETAIAEPKHPLAAMTMYELRDYRRQLESAIDAELNRRQPARATES